MDTKNLELRDWLAGQALMGLLCAVKTGAPIGPDLTPKHLEPYTRRAYEFADAMLRERERKPG